MTSKVARLKSKPGAIIQDQSAQLKCWIEHYLELNASINTVSSAVLDDIPDMPLIAELDVVPAQEELSNAIYCLACVKVPGNDGKQQEVLKNGKTVFFQPLHELLSLSWEQ